jgi:hypothetical protein
MLPIQTKTHTCGKIKRVGPGEQDPPPGRGTEAQLSIVTCPLRGDPKHLLTLTARAREPQRDLLHQLRPIASQAPQPQHGDRGAAVTRKSDCGRRQIMTRELPESTKLAGRTLRQNEPRAASDQGETGFEIGRRLS